MSSTIPCTDRVETVTVKEQVAVGARMGIAALTAIDTAVHRVGSTLPAT